MSGASQTPPGGPPYPSTSSAGALGPQISSSSASANPPLFSIGTSNFTTTTGPWSWSNQPLQAPTAQNYAPTTNPYTPQPFGGFPPNPGYPYQPIAPMPAYLQPIPYGTNSISIAPPAHSTPTAPAQGFAPPLIAGIGPNTTTSSAPAPAAAAAPPAAHAATTVPARGRGGRRGRGRGRAAATSPAVTPAVAPPPPAAAPAPGQSNSNQAAYAAGMAAVNAVVASLGSAASTIPSGQGAPPTAAPRTRMHGQRFQVPSLASYYQLHRTATMSHAAAAVAEPPPSASLLPVSARPPCPPNWASSLAQATAQVMSPFLRVPAAQNSAEYNEIARLFGSPSPGGATVVSIDRIVNPHLWRGFSQARSQLLANKSDDLQLLAALGFSEHEVLQRAHVTLNFDKHLLHGSPYSDNILLLWHGSRHNGNVDTLLTQGLDERLGNASGGLLGRGIYFSDDPAKARQYDQNGCLILFAVLLGDCVSVSGGAGAGGNVREPEKAMTQKRGPHDLFFDSTVGRPTGAANEFVIFNRALCCPLYTVKYSNNYGGAAAMPLDNGLIAARSALPSFAWNYPRQQDRGILNPFFATTVFGAMAADQVGAPEDVGPVRAAGGDPKSAEELREDEALAMGLSQLTELGFGDDEKNKRLLLENGGVLELVVDILLQEAAAAGEAEPPARAPAPTSASGATGLSPFNITIDLTSDGDDDEAESPRTAAARDSKRPRLPLPASQAAPMVVAVASTSTSAGAASNGMEWLDSLLHSYDVAGEDMQIGVGGSAGEEEPAASAGAEAAMDQEERKKEEKIEVAPASPPPDEECPICFSEYPPESQDWKKLDCTHKICHPCATRLTTTGTTMGGQSHTFLKCPLCQARTGIQVGDCPDGSMTILNTPTSASGHEGFGSISIRYYVNVNGYHLDRTAYLPDNPEGQRVLALLRTAWDRRLCFTIGTSMTTGAQNVLVWNIHHKTGLHGGAHGYPDPSYLHRVLQELQEYGIQ